MLIEIRLLGGFSARRGGEEIPPSAFRQRLTRNLVQVLLTRRGEFVPRETLTEALWPRRAPADPAANLRVLVNLARRAFGDPGLLLTRRDGYSFASGEGCVVDAEVFLGTVKAGHREMAAGQPSAALREFQAALDLWGGEPLAENAQAGWAQEYRSRLGRAHGQALEAAGAAALALRHIEAALTLAELAVARDPLKESGQLLLVHALAAAGDVAGALGSLDAFRRRFADELGIDLSPEAVALQARLLRREPLGPVMGRRPFAVTRGLAVFEELPFVGREQELATILFALSRSVPSTVVVSGIAGVGKSRLLSEVATRSVVPVIAARAFLPERDDAWALARSLLREALAMDYQAARALPDRPAQALADLVPELEDLRPLRASSLDPESRRALALKGSALLMWALGAQGTLVVVDDLHWADGSSLDLLGLIIRRAPIQMVLAYRPEEVDETGAVAGFLKELAALDRHVTTVALEPLRPEAISELVPDEKLAAVISEATDRTPHALGELIRALAREGSIQSDDKGRWRPRRGDATARAGKPRWPDKPEPSRGGLPSSPRGHIGSS